MSKSLVLKPSLSEKTYTLSQNGVYVFKVPAGSNKHSVASAVSAQFEVKVASVNIANVSGKPKRTISNGGRRVSKGNRSDFRKAYVSLEKGQSIPIFAGIEEAEQQETKAQEEFDKAAAKQADKESKPKRKVIGRKKKDEDK